MPLNTVGSRNPGWDLKPDYILAGEPQLGVRAYFLCYFFNFFQGHIQFCENAQILATLFFSFLLL